MNPIDTPTLFSVAQAKAYLGVSEATIRRRIADGTLHAQKIGENTSAYVITRDELERFAESQQPTTGGAA